MYPSFIPTPVTALFITALLLFTTKSSSSDQFMLSFSTLSTIAGKGMIDDGDSNGWNTEFEEAPAVNAELSRPHIAMADSAGNIYIADKLAHAVRKVSPKGIITTLAGTNSPGDGGDGIATEQALKNPNGLWVNKYGDCYILDLGNSKIRKVTTDGVMTTVVHDEAGMAIGRGLWVSTTEDTIWYANGSQIKRWTEIGGITVIADGFSGSLGNIMQAADGNLYVTDRSANLVYQINQTGNKTVIAGNGTTSGGGEGFPALETGFKGVRGIWLLKDNSYFLATHEGSQVWYVDNGGTTHLFIDGKEGDEYYSGDGEHYRSSGFKVSEVRAVTVDYQGNVLVTENDRGFIRCVKKGDSGIRTGRPHAASTHQNLTILPLPGAHRFLVHGPAAAISDLRLYRPCGSAVESNAFSSLLRTDNAVLLQLKTVASGLYFLALHTRTEVYYGTIFSNQ